MMKESIRPVTLSDEALVMLRRVGVATLTAELLKRGFCNTFMRGVNPLRLDIRMVGYAVTLRYVPAREDVVTARYNNRTNAQRIAHSPD